MSETESGEARRRPNIKGVGRIAERSGIAILLVALFVFFSFDHTTSASFISAGNFKNIFGNQSVTGLIAIGSVLPLVANYIDLSVSAIAGISSVAMASAVGPHNQPIIVGLILGIGLAVIFGSINGFLVAYVRLSPFICTLGTYTLIGGLLQLYTGGQTISNNIPISMWKFTTANFLGVPRSFWLLMAVSVLAWYMLTQTPFGRNLTAIGSNETAARLAGLRVQRTVFLTFVMSGLLGGIAGILLMSQSLGADATTGPSYIFPALAAVYLGQTAIRPGQYNVWGTIIGVFLVAVAVDGLLLMGAQGWVDPVFDGGALVVSVTFSTLMARARDRRARAVVMHTVESAPNNSESGEPMNEIIQTQ